MKMNKPSQSIRNIFGTCTASCLLAIVITTPAQANTSATNTQWTGNNSSTWTDNDNWTVAPNSGSDIMVTDSYSSQNNAVTYSNPSNTNPGGNLSSAFFSLLVDGSSNLMSLSQSSDSLNTGTLRVSEVGMGTYNIAGGSLNVTSSAIDGNYNPQSLIVGDYGTGIFEQNNNAAPSSVSALEMTLGNMYGSSGSYTMTDTSSTNALSLNINDREVIGENGTGTFTQNGGINTTGTLIVGDGTGQASNSYTLNSGTLIVNGATSIGNIMGDTTNTASFTQTGGSVTTSAFSMANGCMTPDNGGGCAPGSAAYATISGGNFNVTGLATIGSGGYAQYTQSGTPTVSTISNLIVGATASSLETTNTLATLGLTSQGVVNLLGGTLHVSNNVVIGAGDSTSSGPASIGISYGTNGIANQTNGHFIIDGGLTVGQAGNIIGGQGNYNLSGGQLAVAGSLAVGEGNGSASGSGVFSESNGALSANSMTITTGSNFNYSGGSFSLSSGTGILTNEGQINITGGSNLTVSANIINDGNFKVTGTSVEFTGNFINNGAYHSDPSSNVFNGLIVSKNGYLTGGLGDVFKMQGDFYSNSTSGLWSTSTATLEFTASQATHKMTTTGTALGQYDWGILKIDSGASLNLNGTYTVAWLDLMDGITQLSMLTGNFTIYYDASLAANDYLAGISDNGHLVAYNTPSINPDTSNVPEPSTWILLALGLLTSLLHRRRLYI